MRTQRNRRGTRVPAWALGAVIPCLLAPVVRAQPVPSREPDSTHVFPAGGRRGTKVAVRIGGECLPPQARLRMWGQGITASPVLGAKLPSRGEPAPRRKPTEIPIYYPNEWEATIEIGERAPLGPRWWRLTCARGGTGTRPFLVGDLPEFIETESNSLPDRAERIVMPVTVNGQIDGERDLDYYRVTAEAGDVVVCSVVAARLGSPLDAALEIRTADGRRVRTEETHAGRDPVVAFQASQSGDYLILVSNVGVHGGPSYVYRMTVSAAPYVSFAFPPGGVAGQTLDLRLFALSGTDAPRILEDRITLARDHVGELWLRGLADSGNPVPMLAGRTPESVEAEDNDAPERAMPLTLPLTVSGQFLTAEDEDWFQFEATKGTVLGITCRPYPRGTAALPVVQVVDADGKVLAEARSVESPDRQARIEWSPPSTGTYRLRLRDLRHGSRGGPDFIYRLSVQLAQPDFAIRLPADFANVVQAGETKVPVAIARRGGFDGAVELAVEGLPAGVRAEPAEVPVGKSETTLVLRAGADARPADAVLRVVGRATIGGEKIERTARALRTGIDAERVGVGVPWTDRLHLTVQHKPVFRLFCSEAYQYAHRGTIHLYGMEIERLDGFDGDIVLQIGDRQNRDLDGIEMIETVVPAGQTRPMMPIYLPESMHINEQSQSQLYVQAYTDFQNRWGERQSLLVVSEKRCMIRTLPTVVKLEARDKQLTAQPGATVPCRLRLKRTSNFPGGMTVQLYDPADAGLTAAPARFGPGQTETLVNVHVDDDVVAHSDLALRFRGTGELRDGVTVITETEIALRIVTAAP